MVYRFAMLLTLLLAFCSGAAQNETSGALTASKAFTDIPLEVLDIIRPSTRLDMLDYYNQADSLITVTDALGGESRLETVTEDYIKVALTPVSTLEIKLLPYKKELIVMTLYTTGGDGIAKDTQVSFFDSNLQPVSARKFLMAPDIKRFFDLKGSDITEKELAEEIPFETIEYSTGPSDTPLKAEFTTLSVLSDEIRERLSRVLVPQLSSSWNGQFKF